MHHTSALLKTTSQFHPRQHTHQPTFHIVNFCSPRFLQNFQTFLLVSLDSGLFTIICVRNFFLESSEGKPAFQEPLDSTLRLLGIAVLHAMTSVDVNHVRTRVTYLMNEQREKNSVIGYWWVEKREEKEFSDYPHSSAPLPPAPSCTSTERAAGSPRSTGGELRFPTRLDNHVVCTWWTRLPSARFFLSALNQPTNSRAPPPKCCQSTVHAQLALSIGLSGAPLPESVFSLKTISSSFFSP